MISRVPCQRGGVVRKSSVDWSQQKPNQKANPSTSPLIPEIGTQVYRYIPEVDGGKMLEGEVVKHRGNDRISVEGKIYRISSNGVDDTSQHDGINTEWSTTPEKAKNRALKSLKVSLDVWTRRKNEFEGKMVEYGEKIASMP